MYKNPHFKLCEYTTSRVSIAVALCRAPFETPNLRNYRKKHSVISHVMTVWLMASYLALQYLLHHSQPLKLGRKEILQEVDHYQIKMRYFCYLMECSLLHYTMICI